MFDIGEFQPTSVTSPTRSPTGTTLARLTTSEEQKAELLARMGKVATEHKAQTVRATMIWTRLDPTVIEVTFTVEHVDGKRVWISDQVTEMMPNGSEIPPSEKARLARLQGEIAELNDQGMM